MDIGANVGYYTMMAAVLVGDRGCVVSFEPEKGNFINLKHNSDINGLTRCMLENLAVGDVSGETVLNINPLNEGGHSLNKFEFYNDSMERWPKEEVERRFPGMEFEQKIACVSLDDYLRENSLGDPVPTVVKIDVEGFEMNVLMGMKGLLMRADAPNIICEVKTRNKEIFDLLASFNYKPFTLDRNGIMEECSAERILGKGDYLFIKSK
jgi:FkbM family methyltransferase